MSALKRRLWSACWGAADILRQRAVGITGQMKLAHRAGEHWRAGAWRQPAHDPRHPQCPLFEAYMGIKPGPPQEQLACRGTLVVENGSMSIAYNDRHLPEPDWDEYARQAVVIV